MTFEAHIFYHVFPNSTIIPLWKTPRCQPHKTRIKVLTDNFHASHDGIVLRLVALRKWGSPGPTTHLLAVVRCWCCWSCWGRRFALPTKHYLQPSSRRLKRIHCVYIQNNRFILYLFFSALLVCCSLATYLVGLHFSYDSFTRTHTIALSRPLLCWRPH